MPPGLPTCIHPPARCVPLPQVLGLQRSERLMHNRAAARSLLRAARDATGQRHEQYMAAVYKGQHVVPRQPLGDRPAPPLTAAVALDASLSSQAGQGPSAPSQAAGVEEDGEAEQLLMEAARCASADLHG